MFDRDRHGLCSYKLMLPFKGLYTSISVLDRMPIATHKGNTVDGVLLPSREVTSLKNVMYVFQLV